MNLIGIDKTVVKNFSVRKIDVTKLISMAREHKDSVTFVQNVREKFKYFAEERDDNFNFIEIHDNYEFCTLKIGLTSEKTGAVTPYSFLDISIAHKGDSNINPLSITAYRAKVDRVVDYISNIYGIDLDISNARFDKVELNATIELDEEFKQYMRAIQVLMCMPRTDWWKNKSFERNGKESCGNSFNTAKMWNDRIAFKFYDKTKQVKSEYGADNINKNLLRAEYTLKNWEKVSEIFDKRNIHEITDAQIREFVKDQFKKDFVDRSEKHATDSKTELTKLAKQAKREHKNWICAYMNTIRDYEQYTQNILLIDVLDLKDIIKRIDKKNAARNYRAICKHAGLTYTDTRKKMCEIFDKISNI